MKRLTQTEFTERVRRVHGEGYTVVGTYQTNSKPVEIRHGACGRTWSPKPNFFLMGSGCPHCNDDRARRQFSKTHEQYAAEVVEVTNGEYRAVGTYVNSRTKVLIEHVECGHQWEILPVNFLKPGGNRCPRCRSRISKAVRKIEHALTEAGIAFEREKTFEACRLQNPLPFDFFVPASSVLIEYDGELHDRPFQVGSSESRARKLELTRKRDEVKTAYAAANGFQLVRIRHDQDLDERIRSLLDLLVDEGSTTSPRGRRLKRAEMGSTPPG
jgi:very-short-patch-repair endonuclease